MNKHSLKILLGSSVALPCLASAAWSLVDNFDAYTEAPNFYMDTISSEAEIFLTEVDGNQGFYIYTGDFGVGWADTRVSIPLTTPIGAGDTATVFWRSYRFGPSSTWHMCATDVDAVAAWGDLSPIVRVTEDSTLSVRNGGAYVSPNTTYENEDETWYNYWMVINYDSNSYQVYAQGPDDASPVQMMFGDPASPDLAFRRTPEGPLDFLVVASNSGHPNTPNLGDEWVIDDIYIDFSSNLSNPLEAPQAYVWGGIEARADGWLVADGWLGWMHTGQAPWMYSSALGGYIYAPDPGADAAGTWVYVPKR
jgi:hypothetical protein